MEKKRVMQMLIFWLELAAAVILLGASFYLLIQYASYGAAVSGTAGKGSEQKADEQTVETSAGSETETGAAGLGYERQDSSLLTSTAQSECADAPGGLPQEIRVQILGDQYLEPYHSELEVTCSGDFAVQCEEKTLRLSAGEVWSITASEIDQMIRIVPDGKQPLVLPSLKRAQESPAYSGRLYIYPEEQGILLVNEVPLETYLEGVVSSEMPSDYPMEALCAQAVCARTYAVHCMERVDDQDSVKDLDDSVSFQVYNNYQKNEVSAAAVRKTQGEILDLEEALYYSTSCMTERRTDLGDEAAFASFLDQEPSAEDEYGSPWLRWSVSVSASEILERLKEEYGCDWKSLDGAEVLLRSPSGQVQTMEFRSGDQELSVEGEYGIRKVLTASESSIRLRDGTEVDGMQLLPSAFFIIQSTEVQQNGIRQMDLLGGGYGHGSGMSQNGAAAMASRGASYPEILEYYYDTRVKSQK